MEWPIARGINGDEKVEIQILAHNRSTFIKKDDKSLLVGIYLNAI